MGRVISPIWIMGASFNMSQRNTSAENEPLVSRTHALRNAVSEGALCTAIGRGERYSVREIVSPPRAACPIHTDRVREGPSRQGGLANTGSMHANHLMLALSQLAAGPRATNTVLALIGYVGTPLDEGQSVQPMQLVAEAMADLSAIASAAADNIFDHTERPRVEHAADHMIEILTPISSRRVM
jgi:hypothetical protein